MFNEDDDKLFYSVLQDELQYASEFLLLLLALFSCCRLFELIVNFVDVSRTIRVVVLVDQSLMLIWGGFFLMFQMEVEDEDVVVSS